MLYHSVQFWDESADTSPPRCASFQSHLSCSLVSVATPFFLPRRRTSLVIYDFVLRILHQNTLLLTSLLLIFRFIDKSSVTYIASGLIKEGTVVHTLSESTWSNMKSFVCSVAFPYMLVTIVAAYDDSVSTSISVARCRLDCFEMLPTYHHDTCDYSREDYCQLVGECQQVCTCPYIYM
jgi:hypothetical protein